MSEKRPARNTLKYYQCYLCGRFPVTFIFFITACIISQIAGSRELGDGVDANIKSVNP